MRTQKGFTLIELLLVLAIIGIISAIAIPALLGQRARARDKGGIANATEILGEIGGAWDKLDPGTVTSTTLFTTNILGTAAAPVIPMFHTAKNPWGKTNAGFAPVIAETSYIQTAVKATATAATLGQVQMGFLPPSAGVNGCVSTAVYVNGATKDATGTTTNVFATGIGVD